MGYYHLVANADTRLSRVCLSFHSIITATPEASGVPSGAAHTPPRRVDHRRSAAHLDYTRISAIAAKELRCMPGSFECHDGSCIPDRYVCDGEANCSGGEEEVDCAECSGGYFHCTSADICIPEHFICDSFNDCPGGEDEVHCSATSPPDCGEGYYKCNGGSCINNRFRCDSFGDCPEGDDEIGCTECTSGFHCQNDICIQESYICDDIEDCERGEDESKCDCEDTDYLCSNGHCIPDEWHCDGITDCFGGDDELNCGARVAPMVSYSKIRTHTRAQTKLLRKLAKIRRH